MPDQCNREIRDVDTDDGIPGGVRGRDCLGIRVRPERWLQVAVVKQELVGVVLRPSSLCVDDRKLAIARNPFGRRIAVNVFPDPVPPESPIREADVLALCWSD